MLKSSILAAVFAVAAASGAEAADVSGPWLVSGKVASFSFTLRCAFQQAGEQLTGACVDASTSDPNVKGGRSHPLTAGRVAGDRVSFTYGSSFLFTKFDVTYDGTVQGPRMSGEIAVQGRTGAFTAERLPAP
jgi:opacity protein-like surface antigen